MSSPAARGREGMLCCSAPAREAPGPLVELPPCVVTAAKTKLKEHPSKFAPGPKYPGADGAEAQFKDPLEVGAALELVFKPVAAATELPGHGLPQLSKDKKGEDWINVQMPAPDAAPAGTKPLQGWVPKAAVDCPGLALNYDHLAVELMGGAEAATPTDKGARTKCDKLVGLRFLNTVSKVAYPLLEVGGPVECTDALKAQLARSYKGPPARRGGLSNAGVAGALQTLEAKYLSAGTRFACGDEPCIADLSVVPSLLLLSVVDEFVQLSPAVQTYVRNFEEHFKEKWPAIKAPVEEWVGKHRPRVAGLGLALGPSA